MKTDARRPLHFFIPLWLYLIACFLPVFKEDYNPGFSALLMGWMGMLGLWPVFFAWLANFFFYAAYTLSPKRKYIRILFALLSILLGCCFFLIKEIPENEGGGTLSVSPGIGVWFWLGSFLYLFFMIIVEKPAAK